MHIEVENVGDRHGDYVCLLFVRPPNAGVRGRPRQLLVDFTRVHVGMGRTARLSFTIRASSLALANGGDRAWEVAVGQWTFFLREQGQADHKVVSLRIQE